MQQLVCLLCGVSTSLLCGVAASLAQNVTASTSKVACTGPQQQVSGSVDDISGGLVPFASIKASCGARVWRAQANDTGRYHLALPAGEYRIEASAEGYSDSTAVLRVAIANRQEAPVIVLNIAPATSSVTVRATGGVTADFAPTSTKSNLPILQQPFAIETVTSDEMLQQNPQSMVSALTYTSGVQSLSANGPAVMAVDAFNLRGSAADEYLDGMRLPQSFNAVQSGPGSLQLDPNDLQRIDILLGPSSTLYGQSNLGGIVDAVSKVPVRTQVRTLQLQVGSFDRYQGGADFSGRIGHSDRFLYRIDGIARQSDTYVYGMQDNRLTLNPSISWIPTDKTRINFYGKYLRNRSDSVTAYLPALGTVQKAPYGYLPVSINLSDPTYDRYRKDQFMAGYSLDHRGHGPWSIRHQARFVRMGANMHFLFPLALLPDGVTVFRTTYLLIPTIEGIQSDTHAQRTVRTGPVHHTLLGGADFQWQRYNFQQGFGPASSLNVTHPVYGQGDTIPAPSISQRQTQFQGGLYGQEQAEVSHFTVIAGGRVDFTAQDTFNKLTHTPVTSQSPHAFSGHAGVSYRIAGIAPYFSYSTSFQPTLGADVTGKPYVPVTGSNLEGGLKYQFEKAPLMLRVAGFSMRQQNVLVPDPNNPVTSIQTGEIHTPGVEVQANGTALHSLDYILAFTHIHPVNTIGTVNQGKQPMTVADNTASAWLHYTLHAGRFAGVGIGAGAREVGRSWGTADNTLRVPGFTLFNASLDYTLERWRFAVNANNLGDRRFVNGCTGATFCSYGAPRSIIGSAAFHF